MVNPAGEALVEALVDAPAADERSTERSVGEAWQTLTLTPVGGDGNAEPIQLRVMNTPVDDPAQLLANSPPIASALARGLEQDGWEVNRRQELLPIVLSDGRQVVVPIEEMELRSPELVQF